MKICHLTSAHPRYDTRIFIKQSVSLARNGHDVTLIVADGKGNAEKDKVTIIDVGIGSFGRLERMTRTVLNVYKAAMLVDADIYHFHDPELIPAGLLLKMIAKRVIYDVHEDYPKAIVSRPYLPPLLRRAIAAAFRKLEEFSVRLFDGVVPATPVIAKRFEKLNKYTVLVQNFPILDELHISEDILWDKRSNTVAYLGVISELRGAKEMVEAIFQASEKSAARLVLAGFFSPESYENEIKSLEGWALTEFKGYLDREQVAHLFATIKAGMVLFHPEPNHVSAQPNKLFEYMSAGIPVIASDFPLWREIVEESQSGLLVDPMKPEEIAKAISFLFENPDKAEKMGKCGRQAIKEKYNWDLEKIKLIELYDVLLAEKRKKI